MLKSRKIKCFIPPCKQGVQGLKSKRPDFVLETLSESDDPKDLQDKMKEWIDNGCQLAWMINPQKKETWIYRKNAEVEIKAFNSVLSGEDCVAWF